MAYQLRTFVDIVYAIMDQQKIQRSDTVTKNRIRQNIQIAYDEVQSRARWPWMRDARDLQAEPYYSSGTANVTSGSTLVTISTTITQSKKKYYFSTDGYNEIYEINSHTAGTGILQLQTPYTGTTSATASYKIWTDKIPLPSDCREVVELRHQFRDKPMENMGLQELRRIADTGPKAEGRPAWHSTNDYQDPAPYDAVTGLPASVSRSSTGLIKSVTFASSIASLFTANDRINIVGAGEYTYNIPAIVSAVSGNTLYYTGLVPTQETSVTDIGISVQMISTESIVDRYREVIVYPSISQYRTTIKLDFIKVVAPLENDLDEPLMALHDRIVLFYGGMWLSTDRDRDPQSSDRYLMLFEKRIEQMAGKTGDSPDKPVMVVSKNYLANKRSSGRSSSSNNSDRGFGNGGGGSSSSVSGSALTVAIFDSTGTLVGSPVVDTTELAYLDGASILAPVTLADNTASQVLVTHQVTSYDSVFIMYSIRRGSARESGTITMSTDGTTASVAVGGISSVGSVGVSFDADISAGFMRLLATTTSTGATAAFKGRMIRYAS